jgi:hypothetical protein
MLMASILALASAGTAWLVIRDQRDGRQASL